MTDIRKCSGRVSEAAGICLMIPVFRENDTKTPEHVPLSCSRNDRAGLLAKICETEADRFQLINRFQRQIQMFQTAENQSGSFSARTASVLQHEVKAPKKKKSADGASRQL